MRCAAILLVLTSAAAVPGQATVTRTVAAMGTWLELAVTAAERAPALAASEAAVRAVADVESRLSTWRADSEISRGNAAPPGEPFRPGSATAADVAFARSFAHEAGGVFEPALGALVDAYGLRTSRRWPSTAELEAARGATGPGAVSLRDGTLTRSSAAAWFATDAFAKGIALREAATAVRTTGASATFDFGGQWTVVGGAPLRILIAHPDHRDRSVATLRLQPGCSASTSGNGERRELVDGRAHGHLLDPRTGAFAEDFGSVTVVGADPARADAASTALFVAGPDAGLELAAKLGVEALFVRRDPADPRRSVRLVATPGLREHVEPVSPHVLADSPLR